MKEIGGDIWTFHTQGWPICITTNGAIRRDGACIMGRGVALQARERFPGIAYRIGNYLKVYGNHVQFLMDYNIFTFPVKVHWADQADLALIEQSANELKRVLLESSKVYLPRPGCANGRRDWITEVRPILERVFQGDPRFIVVHRGL